MKVKTHYRATITLNSRETEQLLLLIGRLSRGLSLREFIDQEFDDMSEVIDMLLQVRNNIFLADDQRD